MPCGILLTSTLMRASVECRRRTYIATACTAGRSSVARPLERNAMGMDSAVRKLVKEMRDIVADEVRAQVAGQHGESVSAPEPVALPQAEEVEHAGARVPTANQRTSGEHVVPHAPSDAAQPNFDAAEAAWFLRYSTMKAFYQAVHRYGIPHARRGSRVMLFRRVDLEKFVASRFRGR